MQVSTLLFDLDDTLYPPQTGLWEGIRRRMMIYMVERMGFSPARAEELRKRFLEQYGTTLRGLQHEFTVNSDDFLAFVHDLPLAEYLQPDPALRRMVLSLPQARWVFTNADQAHAGRVLRTLGLEGCFQGVIDVRAIDFLSKPAPGAYLKALQLAGVTQPADCLFFDDAMRNLRPAQELGLRTALVNPEDQEGSADLHLAYLTDLQQAAPELWQPVPG